MINHWLPTSIENSAAGKPLTLKYIKGSRDDACQEIIACFTTQFLQHSSDKKFGWKC